MMQGPSPATACRPDFGISGGFGAASTGVVSCCFRRTPPPQPDFLHVAERQPRRRRRRLDVSRSRPEGSSEGNGDSSSSSSIVLSIVEEARRRRKIRKIGIGSGVGLLSVGCLLQSSLSHSPEPALLATLAFIGAFLFSKKPVFVGTPPLTLGEDIEVKEAAKGKGFGLFALRPIARGTFICDYEGELLDEVEYVTRYPPDRESGVSSSDYVVDLTQGDFFAGDPEYVDGRDPQKSNVARYMNHGISASLCNVRRWHQHFPSRKMRLFAERDIEKGEELQFDYGKAYWDKRDFSPLQ